MQFVMQVSGNFWYNKFMFCFLKLFLFIYLYSCGKILCQTVPSFTWEVFGFYGKNIQEDE